MAVRTAAVAVACAITASACATTVTLQSATGPVEPGATPTPAGSSATPTASPTPTARPALAYDEAIDDYIVDIEAFWARHLPDVFGVDFIPVVHLTPFDPDDRSTWPPCDGEFGPMELYRDNAFYCAPDDVIAWDAEGLFPRLYAEYGDFVLGLVLAHEYGHAIQSRADLLGPDVYMELQADCFSGAWAASLLDTDGPLVLAPSDLDVAVAGFLEFADSAALPQSTPDAHGSAFDRLRAFRTGLDTGAAGCVSYLDDPPDLSQIWAQGGGGDLPLAELLPSMIDDVGLLAEDLGGADAPVAGLPESLVVVASDEVALQSCRGAGQGPDTGPVAFYCPADDMVYAAELDELWSRAGDFAASYLVLHAYATAMVLSMDEGRDVALVALGADCMVGAWSRRWFDAASSAPVPAALALTLSPGDLDEAIVGVLLVPARAAFGQRVPDLRAFERISSFSDGFFDGLDSCALTG